MLSYHPLTRACDLFLCALGACSPITTFLLYLCSTNVSYSSPSPLAQTAELAKLLYFESSKDEPGKLCSLDDYVGRLEPGQKEIYYLMAPNRDLAGVCVFNSVCIILLFPLSCGISAGGVVVHSFVHRHNDSSVSLIFTEASPYFEAFKRSNREVLFVLNPIDEVWHENIT